MDDLEDRARELLEAAGRTVVVDPVAPELPRARPVWPAVAAAVVVLVLAVTVMARWATGSDGSSSPAAPTEVTVPQTLWMTTDQARQVLEERGYLVAVRKTDGRRSRLTGCGLPAGRVMSSEPSASTELPSGATVTVTVLESDTSQAEPYCPDPLGYDGALGLLDLARFGTSDLVFFPTVDLWVDGEQRSVDGIDVSSGAWGDPSPLTRLVDALDQVREAGGRMTSPQMSVRYDEGGQFACGDSDPAPQLTDRPSTLISVDPGLPAGTPAFGCHWVRIYADGDGRIYAVTASDEPRTVGAEPEPEAQRTPSASLRHVGDAFYSFLSGMTPPSFAPKVRLLLGNRQVGTITERQALTRSGWVLPCTSYAERSCPIDLFDAIQTSQQVVQTMPVEREQNACHTVVAALPADLVADLADGLALGIAEPRACLENWEVQLRLDDDRQIYAVNLLLGSP